MKKTNGKNDPLISIVILNHNDLKYLVETIPPLLKLNHPNYEIVVVDNNSVDKSLEYLKRIKNKTELEFRIIENQENFGSSIGRNIGIRNAKGEYILCLDSDVQVNDEKVLNKLYDNYSLLNKVAFLGVCILQKNHETTYIGRYYDLFWGFIAHKHDKSKIGKIFELDRPIKIGFISGGAFFIKKKIWVKIGEFDESQLFYMDDADIGARAYNFGHINYLTNNLYVTHLDVGRQINIDEWCSKYKYFFSGISRGILKNYSFLNLLTNFTLFFVFTLLKTLRQSVKKGGMVWKSYLYSIGYFLYKLPDTLKNRKELQLKRKTKNDEFLKIKPPKFN